MKYTLLIAGAVILPGCSTFKPHQDLKAPCSFTASTAVDPCGAEIPLNQKLRKTNGPDGHGYEFVEVGNV